MPAAHNAAADPVEFVVTFFSVPARGHTACHLPVTSTSSS